MKVAVIGYSASGKSTITKKLGEYYGAQTLHMDSIYWLEGWKERPEEQVALLTEEFLDSHNSWVIDGNYSSACFDRRLEEADIIIMLLFSRFTCLKRAFARYRRYKNTTRPDMGEGCNEKLDLDFIFWILFGGRTKRKKKGFARIASVYAQKTLVFKNPKQLEEWSESLRI